jgi:hypothetical protein
VNPFGARLNAIFGSDISHFDVPDMREVLPEAFELVEDGLITSDDFRDFTFANAVRLWGEVNPAVLSGDCGREGSGSSARGIGIRRGLGDGGEERPSGSSTRT